MFLRHFPNAILTLGLLCGIAHSQPDILPLLLEVPAPPLPNRSYGPGRGPEDPGFYNYRNPPADDAPIDELMAYWKHWNQIKPDEAFTIIPSLRVSERLFNEIEENPELIQDYFNVLSHFRDGGHRIETIFESDRQHDFVTRWVKEEITAWLRLNTHREIDKIVSQAGQVRDTGIGIEFETELRALANLDWNRAEPIVEKIVANKMQPKSQILGRSLLYEQAMRKGNERVAEVQRKILMDTVENVSAKRFNRDHALRTIASTGDFPGKDDWYFSLLEDESLADSEFSKDALSGLTSFIKYSPPDKYLADMIRLSKLKNIHARTAAVRNLFEIYELLEPERQRILAALLPWLSDREWVSLDAGFRVRLVRFLQQHKLENSVPALLKILRESDAEVNRIDRAPIGSSQNQINRIERESGRRRNQAYALRLDVVIALGNQRNPLAVKPLTDLLPAHRQWDRGTVVKAIHACHGFDGNYQVQAIEHRAREDIRYAQVDVEKEYTLISVFNSRKRYPELSSEISPGSNPSFVSKNWGVGHGFGSSSGSKIGTDYADYFVEPGSFDPREVFPLLQTAIIEQQEPDTYFLAALHRRQKYLNGREYLVSKSLMRYERSWKGPEFLDYLLENAAFGLYETRSILKLLASRKEVRERNSAGLNRLQNSPTSGANSLAACISEDRAEMIRILETADNYSKAFLLACGRLIRANIPVASARPLLESENHSAAIAASRYLESLDTSEARNALYQAARDQAWLLGSRQYFGKFTDLLADEDLLRELFVSNGIPSSAIADDFFERDWDELDFVEKKVKQRLASDVSLLAVYWYQQDAILVFGDRVEYHFADDPARYHARALDEDEYARFTGLLTSYEASDMPAMLGRCDLCGDRQLIMSSRTGGRRILFASDLPSQFEAELRNTLSDFRRKEAELHYWSKQKVRGFEVIYAADRTKIVKFYRKRNRNIAMVRDSELAMQITTDIERLNDDDIENPAVSEEEALYRHEQRVTNMPLEAISWFELNENGLGKRVEAPEGFTLEDERMDELPDFQEFPNEVSGGGSTYLTTAEGLFRITPSGKQLIHAGNVSNPVINSNGDKLLSLEVNKDMSSKLLLFDIRNDIFSEIPPPMGLSSVFPDRYYPRIGRFLLKADSVNDIRNVDLTTGQGFLLDPETLVIESVTSDALKLLEHEKTGLQDTGDARKWAALEREDGTSIGKYNQITLGFEEVMYVPWIRFNSDKMFINENEDAAMVVYNGHLVRIPLIK